MESVTPGATRLRPVDLVVAAALFFLLRIADQQLFGSAEQGAAPLAVLRTAGVVALALAFLRWRSGPTGFFGTGGRRRGMGWAVGIYLCGLPVLLLVAWGNLHLVEALTERSPTHEILRGYTALSEIDQVLTAAIAILLMPLLEEMLFRGFLQRTFVLRPEHGPTRAWIFASLVFALAHGPVLWLPSLVLGLLLGWIDLRSGDLRNAIAVHALHNAGVLAWTAWGPLAG